MLKLPAQKLPAQTTSPEVRESTSALQREKHILQLCHTGQIATLDLLFSVSGISFPAHPITTYNASSHTIPCTYKMVEAAVLGSQYTTIIHLYKAFPATCVHGPELVAAIELGDLRIFKLLAAQSQSEYDVVHKEFPDGETSLIKACKGRKKDVALYLLEEGADPNNHGKSGGVREGALAHAIMDQDLEVVQKLVDSGAVIDDNHIIGSVDRGRVEVVRYLVDKKGEEANLNDLLIRARGVGQKEVERLLIRRIARWKDWPGKSVGKQDRIGGRWERMIGRLQLAKAQGLGF